MEVREGISEGTNPAPRFLCDLAGGHLFQAIQVPSVHYLDEPVNQALLSSGAVIVAST